MDKYEYQVCTEQIKQLISEKRFAEAMEIADTIDWRRVRSVSMLITVSEIYKINKRYEDARDILLLAYEKHPTGKDIVYALCELAIKLNDIVQAYACYKEFCSLAPDDPNHCILLYKIYKNQDVSLEEQIDVLEEFKSKEYIEKWAYELAALYHMTGQEAKCIAACDELILWFGEGKYVRKAMELKMQHTALTPDQQAKYDGRAITGNMPVFRQPYQNQTQFGNNAQQTGPMINKYSEYIQQTGDIYSTGQVYDNSQPQYQAGAAQNMYGQPMQQPVQDIFGQGAYDQNQMYAGYDNAQGYVQYQDNSQQPVTITPDYYNTPNAPVNVSTEMNHLGMTQNIMVQSLGTGVWNTTDLQAQLAPQVMEVLADKEQQEAQAVTEEQNSEAAAETDVKPAEEPKEPEPEISVHTGVIDISAADLPGQDLPRKQETSDIMSKLAGVIPGTVSVPEQEPEQTEDVPKQEEIREVSNGGHGVSTDTNEQVEISPYLPKKQEPEQDIPIQQPSVPEEIKETGQPAEPELKPQQPQPDVLPDINVQAADDTADAESKTQEEPDESDTLNDMPRIEPAVKNVVSEDIMRLNAKAFGTEPKPEINIRQDKPPVTAPDRKPKTEVKAYAEQNIVSENNKISDEKGFYPYDTVTDIGFVEEIPEVDQPDDIDDMLKTRDLPIDQIEAYETDSVPEIDEYEVDDNDDYTPQFMKGKIRASREFDDDEYRIFCRYDGMEPMKAQLVSAMDLMSMEPGHGNIAIMGPQSADCKGIAINLVKAMQSKNPDFSGKVAKISGEALNKKDIKGTLKKLENGALIVEGAGGLTKESILILTGVLTSEPGKVLVIIEGLKDQIKPLFSISKQMRTVFDARIDIADFTDEDLVNYGRGYALEKEYFIDDMGGLALHNRISEMQTYDHQVTVDEVRELVDSAIKHVDKKNMGHFMDMLLGRRYDDEDNIILSEKDFEF